MRRLQANNIVIMVAVSLAEQTSVMLICASSATTRVVFELNQDFL